MNSASFAAMCKLSWGWSLMRLAAVSLVAFIFRLYPEETSDESDSYEWKGKVTPIH